LVRAERILGNDRLAHHETGDGPPVVWLSNNRKGIRESDNAAWQASRVRR
jgi:hypothetical protein